MKFNIIILAFAIFVPCVLGQTCQTPKVQSKVYSTVDATVVSDVAFVAEFTCVCKNAVKELNLYADINGETILPVIESVGEKNKFQVSWTEDAEKTKSGNRIVKIYDFEGYTNLKKSQRTGEESKTKPLFSVDVNYQGSYSGPSIKTEFVAFAAAFVVWYFAYSSKSKIMA